MTIQTTSAERGLLRLVLRDLQQAAGSHRDVIAHVLNRLCGVTPLDPDLRPDAVSVPPWSEDEVASLAAYQTQNQGRGHPFTCGEDDCRRLTGGAPLVPGTGGWACPSCGYAQRWAWMFMTTWIWRLPGPWALISFAGLHSPDPPAMPAGPADKEQEC